MNKYLICLVIAVSLLNGCGAQNIPNAPIAVEAEDVSKNIPEDVPDASVFIYVNSSEVALENIMKELGKYSSADPVYRLYGDAKKSPDGKITLTIEYFFAVTEKLISFLRQESSDEVVYGEKTMTQDKESKKEKNMLFVKLELIPVKLLDQMQ